MSTPSAHAWSQSCHGWFNETLRSALHSCMRSYTCAHGCVLHLANPVSCPAHGCPVLHLPHLQNPEANVVPGPGGGAFMDAFKLAVGRHCRLPHMQGQFHPLGQCMLPAPCPVCVHLTQADSRSHAGHACPCALHMDRTMVWVLALCHAGMDGLPSGSVADAARAAAALALDRLPTKLLSELSGARSQCHTQAHLQGLN